MRTTSPLLLPLLALLALVVVACSASPAPWSRLYGMGPTVELQKLDTASGQVIEQTDPLAFEAQGQGLGTIDPVDGIYYFVGTNISAQTISLVGVSASSGAVVSETLLPIELEPLVGVGQFCDYDIEDKDVLVVGRDYKAKDQHAMLRVNPRTGSIRTLSKIGDFGNLDLLGGSSFFDSASNIEWFQMPINNSGQVVIRFYGYSGETGTLLNMLDNPLNLANAAFDRTTGVAYGVGARQDPVSGQLIRQLASFESATGVFTHIADLPTNYVVMMGSIATLDEVNGLLYCFILKGNSSVTLPLGQDLPMDVRVGLHRGMHNSLLQDDEGNSIGALPGMNLVAIDIKTGKIVTSPPACSEFPDCSWNLEFLNQS